MQQPETKSASPRAVSLRHLQPEDTPQILSVVRSVDLDLNSAYAYAMFGEYFSATSLVAVTEDGTLAGFVIGFVPPTSPDTVFVWQLRRLPGKTDPGYDEAAVSTKARAFKTIIAAELAVPVLLYIIFNLIVPEEGAMVLF